MDQMVVNMEELDRKRERGTIKGSHQLTMAIVSEPGRLLEECNISSKRVDNLFASDVSSAGSSTGWPLASHKTLNLRSLPAITITEKRSE